MLTRRELLQLMSISTGALSLAPILSGCAVDPVTGRQQLILLSETEELNLDKAQSPHQFSADYGKVDDPSLNHYLNQVGLALVKHSHRPQMPFSFQAVNATYLNAYAFPGGSIAATRGILLELSNEGELAALLSHEIGHVAARHSAERATKGILANALLAGTSVAVSAAGFQNGSSLIQDLGVIGAGALLAHYSRDNEHEADKLGMKYMVSGGYSPKGMIGLMEILLKNKKHKPTAIELMFATHPMSKNRLRIAANRLKSDYSDKKIAPLFRDRYMDNVAHIRNDMKTIHSLQAAETSLQKKKYEKANQQISSALKTSPSDYTALVMMSKCQLSLNKPLFAEKHAALAIEIYPKEAQAHLLLGICSLTNKRFGMAYSQFDRYEKLLSGNPNIIFFKGLAREGMQNTQKAAKQYARYLRMVNRGQKAQYAYNKLKKWGYLQ